MEVLNLEEEWASFFNDNNNELSLENEQEQSRPEIDDFVPECSDIKISTKTKIIYLNQELNLNDLFWKIKIIPYDSHDNGIIKKQIKFNFTNKEEVAKFEENIKNESNVNVKILNQVDNPNGRVVFKDVRKVNVGYCKNDIMKNKKNSKSAFYNCLVLIYRMKINSSFKEIHIKIFNSGKLEIPGIQTNEMLERSINVVIEQLSPYINSPIFELNEKRETVLVNSNFTCNYYINRGELFKILKNKYKIKCNYDSCSYPGIQCKYKSNGNEISFMIFRTGSVLIVGKCEDDVLFEIYEFLKNVFINEYKDFFETRNESHKEEKTKKKAKKCIYIYK